MTHIATGLVQRGWAVRVYCARPSYLPNQENPLDAPLNFTHEGVEVIRVPVLSTSRDTLSRRVLNSFTFLLSVAWYLFRDRKEILGVINTTNPPFLGIVTWLAKWFLGIPYLTIVHDVYPDVAVRLGVLSPSSPITWIWDWVTRIILNQSAGIIVIGRDMAQLIRSKLWHRSSRAMSLIPHWADTEDVYFVPREENVFVQEHQLADRFVIQYSGRLGRVHNLEPLIDAAQQLQDTPVLFQLIGEGAKKADLEERVQAAGLTNVQFLPYQPYETLAHSLSAADMAVVCLEGNCDGVSVPSKTYGLLACGRPVLALMSNESEIGQMVAETGSGVVLEKATGESIAETIRHLIEQPDELAQMSANAYQAFVEDYSLAVNIERYDTVIRQHFGLPVMQPVMQPDMQSVRESASHRLPLKVLVQPKRQIRNEYRSIAYE